MKTSFNKFNSPKYQLEGKKIIRFGFVKYEKGDVEIKFDVFYLLVYHDVHVSKTPKIRCITWLTCILGDNHYRRSFHHYRKPYWPFLDRHTRISSHTLQHVLLLSHYQNNIKLINKRYQIKNNKYLIHHLDGDYFKGTSLLWTKSSL